MKPPEYILPHAEFGDAKCSGLLLPVERGEIAYITCTECGRILRAVLVSEVTRVLNEMQLTLDVVTEKCSHCGSVNLIPGFSRLSMFTCRSCGRAVRVPGGLE